MSEKSTQCTESGCDNTAIPPDYLVCPEHSSVPDIYPRNDAEWSDWTELSVGFDL